MNGVSLKAKLGWILVLAIAVYGGALLISKVRTSVKQFAADTPALSIVRLTNRPNDPLVFDCVSPQAWIKQLYIARTPETLALTPLEGSIDIAESGQHVASLTFTTTTNPSGLLRIVQSNAVAVLCFKDGQAIDLASVVRDGGRYSITFRLRHFSTNPITLWMAYVQRSAEGH